MPGVTARWPPALAQLLRQPRYEVMPSAATEESVLAWVPREITVTITASPVKGLEPTLALTERLAAHGYQVVPHLSARLVRDRAHLADITRRLTAAGVSDVFVPAGDADPPAGEYDDALAVLADLAALGGPFARLGITGYPESHPRIADDVTIQAMWDKRRHASYLVSNICFDPAALARWITRIRARGVTLPLLVGLPGPVERTRLLAMAARSGVGESTRFLARHGSWLVRLGVPGGYSPALFLSRSAATLTDPASCVAGLHLFTFNQVRQTEQWRRELLDRIGSNGSAGNDGPVDNNGPVANNGPADSTGPPRAVG
jgi:methylenetetrahydrofolate reductase (NADPH)